MWRKEHLWDFSVLQRGHFFKLVFFCTCYCAPADCVIGNLAVESGHKWTKNWNARETVVTMKMLIQCSTMYRVNVQCFCSMYTVNVVEDLWKVGCLNDSVNSSHMEIIFFTHQISCSNLIRNFPCFWMSPLAVNPFWNSVLQGWDKYVHSRKQKLAALYIQIAR
jgi:hypothetical protein